MRLPTRLGRTAWLPCALRPFSSTAARRATIPEFVQSSSKELDETLQKARDYVILPKHLSPRESRIVFGTKHRDLFNQEEPVTATIGGTTVQLQPLDPVKRNVDRWNTLKHAVKLAQTKDDWTNVERLLEGYHKAGIKMKDRHINQVLRKIWVAGQHDRVLRLLERAHETGMRIQTQQVLSMLLWGMRGIATSSRWARKDVDRALTGARQIADLLESPQHAGGDRAVKPGDLRTLPITIAVPLELLAVKQIKHPSKDPDARQAALHEVRELANRLMNNLKIYGTSDITRVVDSKTPATNEEELGNRYDKYKLSQIRLLRAVPVWHAVALSKRLLGADMPEPAVADKMLADIHAIITESVQAVRANVQGAEENWSIKAWEACEWVDEKA
ncbi:hypothetical protein IWZ01DRAFT_333704 [Phyllosticta capitalensis]